MKVIKNKYIPFKGFKAINICGIIFQRSNTKPMTNKDLNHESIHTAQMKELGYIGFYIIYLLEWLYWLTIFMNSKMAYRAISFEREAYSYERDLSYLSSRPHYAQWRL